MMIGERNDAANVEIEVDIDGKSLPLLRADEARLRQIVLNLLTNAVKYTPEEGTVSVRLSYDAAAGFELQIADTGVGIADIPSALASFEQGADAQDRTYEGIGLGLPFSKSLVERHGGTLQLQSQVGVGTTVTLLLPSERAVAAAGSDAGLASAQN
jgi:two-component system cell cycle sensor histidine kinase PleC